MQEARLDIVAAYLFGSSIRPKQNPRDVDLIIVAMGKSGSISWRRAIAYRNSLKDRFIAAFGTPLSAMVVTPSEWLELDGSVVRQRLSIL
jgi:predicted nucleotidyltransferase